MECVESVEISGNGNINLIPANQKRINTKKYDLEKPKMETGDSKNEDTYSRHIKSEFNYDTEEFRRIDMQDINYWLELIESDDTPEKIKIIAKKEYEKAKRAQKKYWFLTLNNYSKEHLQHIKNMADDHCDRYAFQEELGEKTKTPHIQGCFSFIGKGKRFTEVKELFGNKCYLAVVRNIEGAFKYCCKEETRNGEVFIKGKIQNKKEKPKLRDCDTVEEENLRPFQKWIYEIVKSEKYDKRTIYWLYNINGNVGKTELAKFLIEKLDKEHDKIAFSMNSKGHDILSSVYDMLIDKKTEERKADLRAFIANYPKGTKDREISYTTLEAIKDGLIFNGKFKAGHINYATPHMIIFANKKPSTTLNGRIKTFRIDDKHNLVEEDIEEEKKMYDEKYGI